MDGGASADESGIKISIIYSLEPRLRRKGRQSGPRREFDSDFRSGTAGCEACRDTGACSSGESSKSCSPAVTKELTQTILSARIQAGTIACFTDSARRSCFPFESRRVAPQVFQAVKRSFVPMKDVDNDLQIIEHDPLADWKSVNRHGSNGMVLSQTRFNFVCDRF
jgi:hypothetical protein